MLIFFSCRNPSNDQLFGYIDNVFDLNQFWTPAPRSTINNLERFPISELIESCHKNQSIYKVIVMVFKRNRKQSN